MSAAIGLSIRLSPMAGQRRIFQTRFANSAFVFWLFPIIFIQGNNLVCGFAECRDANTHPNAISCSLLIFKSQCPVLLSRTQVLDTAQSKALALVVYL